MDTTDLIIHEHVFMGHEAMSHPLATSLGMNPAWHPTATPHIMDVLNDNLPMIG